MISTTGESTAEAALPQDRLYRPAERDHSTDLSESIIRIPIDMLRDADSPRLATIDQSHVRTLAASGDKLPPIVVHHSTMKVIDGMHRLHAARLNDQESVEIRYFEGSEREAFLLAVELNLKHGLPLTLSDRKNSAIKILQSFPEWSDRAIGFKTGLSGKTVGALRRRYAGQIAQAPVRVGRDGRVRSLNPDKRRQEATGILPAELDSPLREVARTARDMQKRLSADESPLPDGEANARGAQSGVHPMDPFVDPVKQLESLKRDPALKYSDDGREMIRWLEARIIRKTDPGLVLQAPAHQAKKIAAMARACAAQWNRIAMRMELGCDECSRV